MRKRNYIPRYATRFDKDPSPLWAVRAHNAALAACFTAKGVTPRRRKKALALASSVAARLRVVIADTDKRLEFMERVELNRDRLRVSFTAAMSQGRDIAHNIATFW